MRSDNDSNRKNSQRTVEDLVSGRVQRRDLLKASVAAGAAGMFAGRVGAHSTTARRDTPEEQCPTIEGVKNGFVWVQKTTTIWASTLRDADSDDLRASGDGNKGGFAGRGNLGQGKVEFHEPGTYEFRYKVDPNGLTWVEKPESLISLVFPTEPWDKHGVVRSDDVVRWAIYPYERDYPLSMSFDISEPGTYRIAYGPATGNFLVEEWLPEITERDQHMRLGLSIEGDESAYSWVYPEIPQHVWVWGSDGEMMLNRDPNAPAEVDCQLEEPIP
jgi:hypothetical protein